MSTELELKLEVDPSCAVLITDQMPAETGRSQSELSVYYDTPGGKLRKKGFSLRVRSTPQGYVQTVKTIDAGAGLFVRGEWEAPVKSIKPEVDLLSQTPAGKVRARNLQALVRSEVERHLWRADYRGSVLEYAFDTGTVEADGHSSDLSELEIELIEGQPAAAFDRVMELAQEVPLRIGVMSKAERGFALVDGTLCKASKAPLVPISASMNVGEGFAAIAQSCLRHFRLNEPLIIKQREPDALHQARVAMRRLRSALSLFRPALFDADFPRLREELRWFTGQLGQARNLDVLLLREVPDEAREVIDNDRKRAYHVVIKTLNSSRFRLLMLDLVRWISVGGWRGGDKAQRPLAEYARRRIDRLWSKLTAHGDLREMDDEGRHDVRIEIKKLRYGLEFVRNLHFHEDARRKRSLKALEGLQETLGELNDVVTAGELAYAGVPTPAIDDKKTTELIGRAERRLRRLKKVGPYWH